LLAKEFFLPNLAAACAKVSESPLADLSRRVSRLEQQLRTLGDVETISSHERELEQLRADVEDLKRHRESRWHGRISLELERLKEESLCPGRHRSQVEIQMEEANSLVGIISYLRHKHGGNLHEKGIVTVTSTSVLDDDPDFGPENVAGAASDSWFFSRDDPGQWLCWDFGELRLRPTNYTVSSHLLRSWVVEGSVNGAIWTVIDRQSDNQDFKRKANVASFDVSESVECRFVRLSQTDENHRNGYILAIDTVEFFGTLVE
jgi:hypothetical protein